MESRDVVEQQQVNSLQVLQSMRSKTTMLSLLHLQELIALTKDINTYHKVNVILIAHVVKAEYRDTTKKTTHISRQIVTAGKNVAAKIPAYCGEVYHFNIKRGLVEGPGGDYQSTDRAHW